VATPLILLSKPITGLLLDDSSLYYLLIMALIGFVFDLVGQGASAWLLIRSRSVLFAGISLLRLFLGLSLNIWLILIEGMGLDGYFISAMATNMLSGTIFVFIAVKDCGWGYDPKISRTIRGFLLPLIPGSLASFVSRQMERILVKFQIDLLSVGILEMGYKFPVLISQLISRPLLQSWNTRRFEIADDDGAPERISKMFTNYFYMVSFAGLILAVTIKPLLIILTPPEFHSAYRITRVEILTVIFGGAYYHLSFGLFYAKDTKTIAKLRGWSSALKVPLTWFFISNWGIFGAAYSAALTSLAVGIIGFRLSQNKYKLDLEWRKLGLIGGTGIVLFFLITNWNLDGNPIFRGLENEVMPWLQNGLQDTALGTWKEGKAVRVFAQMSAQLSDILLRGFTALSFILLIPYVHAPTKARLHRWFLRNNKG
jgi:O-antigen/teichoic acid export membrane protein